MRVSTIIDGPCTSNIAYLVVSILKTVDVYVFLVVVLFFFFFQAEDGIRDLIVTGVQTCALPILMNIATLPALNASGLSTMYSFSCVGLGDTLERCTKSTMNWIVLSAVGSVSLQVFSFSERTAPPLARMSGSSIVCQGELTNPYWAAVPSAFLMVSRWATSST